MAISTQVIFFLLLFRFPNWPFPPVCAQRVMLVKGMVGLLTLTVFSHYLVRHMTRYDEVHQTQLAEAIHNIIHARYACKQWQEGKIVPRKTMRKILELTQRAPSCFNVQPYKIVIVESDEGKEKLAQAMHGPNPSHIRSSSFAAVFAADPDPIPLPLILLSCLGRRYLMISSLYWYNSSSMAGCQRHGPAWHGFSFSE